MENMKKSFLFMATILVVLFASCKTTKDVVLLQNEIRTDNVVINTCFDKDDYVVLGSVQGESDFVYYDVDAGEMVGDSFCYGTLNQPAEFAIGDGFAVGYGKNPTLKGASALEIAKANAYYDLIQKAYEMGADTILEPTIQVETHTEQFTGTGLIALKAQKPTSYKVTVRAIAVQLKTN